MIYNHVIYEAGVRVRDWCARMHVHVSLLQTLTVENNYKI